VPGHPAAGAGVAASQRARPGSPGLLPVVLAGVALVVLDAFLVNVMLPAMRRDLGASSTALQWTVAGYAITFAAGLVAAGRLGDRVGRLRMLTIGFVAFAVTSAGCGLAPSAAVLVGARLAQGAAAAVLLPQVLGIISASFEGAARARAFRSYTLVVGLSAVAGQLAGGALVQLDLGGLSWRLCFLVNVPVALAATVLARRVVPDSRLADPPTVDLVGATLLTAVLVIMLLPLTIGRGAGWPAWATGCLLAVPPLLIALWLTQRRTAGRGRSPLVPPGLFRRRAFSAGLLVIVVIYAASAAVFFLLAFYLQDTLGLSPLAAGVMFCPYGGGFLAGSLAAGWANQCLGRNSLAAGALLRACGLAGLAALAGAVAGGVPAPALCGPLALDGLGLGLVVGPLLSAVLRGVPPAGAGAASGVLATAQQLGGGLGVAVIGGVYLRAAGTVASFQVCLIALAALCALAVAGIQLLPRADRGPAPEVADTTPADTTAGDTALAEFSPADTELADRD
jgi:MFS family permease